MLIKVIPSNWEFGSVVRSAGQLEAAGSQTDPNHPTQMAVGPIEDYAQADRGLIEDKILDLPQAPFVVDTVVAVAGFQMAVASIDQAANMAAV